MPPGHLPVPQLSGGAGDGAHGRGDRLGVASWGSVAWSPRGCSVRRRRRAGEKQAKAFDTIERNATSLSQIVELRTVLVTDIGMPRIDGFQLIEQIRQHSNPAVRRLPAAALTAYARSDDRVKALRAGFQIHLAKPIDPAELVTTIAALVKRHH